MPIWAEILITFYVGLAGSAFGGLIAFGIFFGNKAFFAKMITRWESDKEESIKDNKGKDDKK